MRNFKSVKQKIKTISFSDQSLKGSFCGVAWRVRVKGQNGRFERVGMVLKAIEVGSEKTECVNIKNVWYVRSQSKKKMNI